MARTKCAFVNFSSVEACRSAISHFKNRLFRNDQLKCRLRIDSNAGSIATSIHRRESLSSSKSGCAISEGSPATSPATSQGKIDTSPNVLNQRLADESQRFFIAKSLTPEDIKYSIATKVWTTQSHVGKALLSALSVSA
jgi:hypothetical protein